MIEFIITCIIWSWIPGANNTNYEFFENGVMTEATIEESVERCRTAYNVPVIHWVVGLNDAGDRSENSNSHEAQWVFNFDCDARGVADGIVGFADFGAFSVSFNKPPPDDGCNFDADGSGWIGFPDFGAFTRAFGQCNNGKWVVPCDP